MKQSPTKIAADAAANRNEMATLQKKEDPFFTFNPQNPFFQKLAVPSVSSAVAQAKTAQPSTPATSKTGLPNSLKTGVEQLSNVSMDDVNVHYNSDKPHQINALAYAQGTNIHLAEGQEKHLPHEAWHVVQQKQGRVQPTTQMPKSVGVNEDKGLEQEADKMGEQAMTMGQATDKTPNQKFSKSTNSTPTTHNRSAVVQRIQVPNLKQTIALNGWWTSTSNEHLDVLEATFKNTLMLLKVSLRNFQPPLQEQDQYDKLLAEVNTFSARLIANPANTTKEIDELDALINAVNLLTSRVPQTQASKLRQLATAEKNKLDTLIEATIALVGTTKANTAVLEQTFEATNATTAAKKQATDLAYANFEAIAKHLTYWKNNAATHVKVNTAPNAGFGGFNQNTGANSQLTVNLTGLENISENQFTLIHEASHGSETLQTRDLGYIGASYFLDMPSHFRLKNADHYSFAAQINKGTRIFPVALGGPVVPVVVDILRDKFTKAQSLGYFKAEKIWMYLMWAKDTYLANKDYMPKPALDAYSASMGLPNRPQTAIQAAHVLTAIEVYNGMQYVLKRDMTYVYDAAKNEMLITRADGKQRLAKNVTPAMSIDDLSTALLDALTQGYELPQGWAIHKEGLMLFDQLFRQGLHLREGDKPKAIETELYNWLKT